MKALWDKMNLIHTTGFGSSVEIATREWEATIFWTLLENFWEQFNVSPFEFPWQGELAHQSLTNQHQIFLALDSAMRPGKWSNIITLNSLNAPIILDAIIANPTLQHRLPWILWLAAAVEPQKAIKWLVWEKIYTVMDMPILWRLTHPFVKRIAKNKIHNGVSLNVADFLTLAKICEHEYRPGIQANKLLKDIPQLYLHNEDDRVIPSWVWDKDAWKNPHATLQLIKSERETIGSNHWLSLHTDFMLWWVKERFKEVETRYWKNEL
jgi:hypothetical protein